MPLPYVPARKWYITRDEIEDIVYKTPEGTAVCHEFYETKNFEILVEFLIPRIFPNLFPSNDEKDDLAAAIVEFYPQFWVNQEDPDYRILYDLQTNDGIIERVLQQMRMHP